MALSSSTSSNTHPLLRDSEIEDAWQEVEQNHCTVKEMFEEHHADVLRYLQSSGIEKIAECQVEDDLIFDTFQKEPLLVFGSDLSHPNDVEAFWRHHLTSLAAAKRVKTTRQTWHNKDVPLQAFTTTIKNAASPRDDGLIRPLVHQYKAQRCSYAVFSLPAVQAVVRFKWDAFARKILKIQLGMYIIWLCSYYLFTAAIHNENLCDPLIDVWQKSLQGKTAILAELISLIAMAPFLFLDLISLTNHGMPWLFDPTNVLGIMTYIFQFLIFFTHLGRLWVSTHWLTYLLSIQCILLMFRLQYFTQCFHTMRFSFSTVIRQVLIDLKWIFLFVFLTCFAYGAAVHIAFRQEKEPPEEFQSFPRAVLAMFEHAYGDLRLKDFVHAEKNSTFLTLLAITYMLFMGYVLINLILGYVIDSLKQALQHQDAKQLCNHANVINEIESILPAWLERSKQREFYPKYIHMLRIDPGKLDNATLDTMWTKHGENIPLMSTAVVSTGKTIHGASRVDSNNGSDSGHSPTCDIEIIKKIQREVQKVEQMLQEQQRLMRSLAANLMVPPSVSQPGQQDAAAKEKCILVDLD